MKRVEARGLCYSYGRGQAVEDVSLYAERGEFVGIIGPKGSGKSTLLKCLYRAIKPQRGTILFDGEDVSRLSYRETARRTAVVGQENDVLFEFSVRDIVAMGRSPYKRFFDRDTAEDERIVAHALEQTVGDARRASGTSCDFQCALRVDLDLQDARRYSCLSGGEKQRVLIARAIAQQTDFLILDEPTNHLDVSCQLDIFDFIKRLNLTVIAAIHDLNMASLYCDRLYVMKAGRVFREGTPAELLTPELIREVYGVTAEAELHPATHRPAVTYLPEWALDKSK